MAVFEYQALTSSGRVMKGTLEASGNQQAQDALAEMHLSVNSLQLAPPSAPMGRIGRSEFLLFNEQLIGLTKSGIPLDQGLRAMAQDVQSPRMRKLLDQVAADLESGMSVDDAFARRESLFPPLYVRIVRAGLKTGRLSEMLTSLNRHLEMGTQTRRIIFEAMAYPLVILALAAVILTFVFQFLIPPFQNIFSREWGSDLPAITMLLFSASQYVLPFWLVVGGLIAAVFLTSRLLSRFSGGRRFQEAIWSNLPVLGTLYQASMLSRLADAMALLVGAGMDVPACLRLGGEAAGSERMRCECGALAGQLEQGQNLAEAGQSCRVIPSLFLYSMQLGYQRNELQENLYSLSEMYAQQARTSQGRLQALLLPVMLILVGGVIAFAILGMFLPISSLLEKMQSSF